MGISIELTPDLLREVLRYDPEDGRFFWRERSVRLFKSRWPGQEQSMADYWNRRNAGKECFLAEDEGGYRLGCIFNKSRRAHRVAWAIQTGKWPEIQIDHINNVRNDNRWGNLRIATSSQNSRNSLAESGAKSAFKGVTWHKRDCVWFTRIYVDGKRLQLGTYKDELEAALAYDEAAKRYFGEFANLNFANDEIAC